jgi:hypothetical protein
VTATVTRRAVMLMTGFGSPAGSDTLAYRRLTAEDASLFHLLRCCQLVLSDFNHYQDVEDGLSILDTTDRRYQMLTRGEDGEKKTSGTPRVLPNEANDFLH